jgi:hypothetical protein
MKNGRNMGQGRKHMKDRNRPKFKIGEKGEPLGGLTKKEIDTWCERISAIRTAMLSGVFTPEVRRWRDST